MTLVLPSEMPGLGYKQMGPLGVLVWPMPTIRGT